MPMSDARKTKKPQKKIYLPALIVSAGLFIYAAYMGAPYATFVRANDMLASATVGAYASVPENPYNSLAAQLAAKEREIEARQDELAAQESALNARSGGLDLPVYSFILSLVLALLVAVNFYMDWRRGRKIKNNPNSIIELRSRG